MTLSMSKQAATRQEKEIRIIQEVVADHHGYQTTIMVSTERHQPVSTIRQTAMFIARELTRASYPDIARSFAKKNHCTIMHACNAMKNRVETDPNLKRTIEILQERARLMINAAKKTPKP